MKLRLPSTLFSLLISSVASLTLASGVSSATDGFSINFARDNVATETLSNQLAGVIETMNWTNVVAQDSAPATTEITKSNEGVALTGLKVDSTAPNHWHGGGVNPSTGNSILLNGYADAKTN
ncbi:MAG: hypothetical protein RSA21_08195, partial [Akkermansia sp.]